MARPFRLRQRLQITGQCITGLNLANASCQTGQEQNLQYIGSSHASSIRVQVNFKSSDFFMPHATLTIGEVASQAGLKASAIRFYEQAGLLPNDQQLIQKIVAQAK